MNILQRYVLLCIEPDTDPYVLSDTATSLSDARLIAKSRCEEFIDEQVSMAAEQGATIGDLILEEAPNSMAHRVFGESDPGLMGRRPVLLRIEIQAVTVQGE